MSLQRHIVAVAVALLSSAGAWAQYDPYYAHYFDMQPSYNPAAAGMEARLNVTAVYAMALSGYEHAPQTAHIAADMPFEALRQVHGVGAVLVSDKIGLFTHQRLGAQYAYHHRLFGGQVSGGVQVGMISEKFRGSEIDLDNSSTSGDGGDDPVFRNKSDISGSALDLAVGLRYQRARWYAALAAQHLTGPTVTLGDRNEFTIAPTFYAGVGIMLRLPNPWLTVNADGLARYDGAVLRGDITGRLTYRHEGRMLYAGITYSPSNSVTALIGGSFHGVILGYSYEAYTNGIDLKNGSHELFVGYQMDVNIGKRGKNRHQTTRTL